MLKNEPGLIPFRNAVDEQGTGTQYSVLSSRNSKSGTHHTSLNTPTSTPGYYKLGFQYDPAAFDGLTRDLFANAMRAEGIAIDLGFRSLHKIHSHRRYRKVGELPNADKADESVLVLHHPVLLGEESDIEQIVLAIQKIRTHATQIQKSNK
ncbi:MAG: DegT/DnrJ/EryC1/StrS family aminotransferase [Planctomycetes bacterium]|nr:DegT/DnrJ/EryC1/StrS family aminotransferase [Planctomycetota bacterium]